MADQPDPNAPLTDAEVAEVEQKFKTKKDLHK